MKINGPALTDYYKICENEGVKGLQNIIDEQIKSISPILLEFKRFNLIETNIYQKFILPHH